MYNVHLHYRAEQQCHNRYYAKYHSVSDIITQNVTVYMKTRPVAQKLNFSYEQK